MLITILSVIIGIIVGYNYYIDQVKIKGGIFSNEIEILQEDLTQLQIKYSSNVNIFKENEMTKNEFQVVADKHFENMQEIIDRYDDLDPPEPFKPSVDLFRLSAESQFERDKQIALWIETGDESYNIRADELHQESFSYELAALADFKSVQLGSNP